MGIGQSTKKTMGESLQTLKKRWKAELRFMAGSRGWVSKRQISKVMGIGYSTVTDAINFQKIPNVVKFGVEEGRGSVRIPVESVFHYIDQFQIINKKKIKINKPPLDQLRQRSLFE